MEILLTSAGVWCYDSRGGGNKPMAASSVPITMKINHNSPVPLHAQVETLIRGMLRKPAFRDGALLPPEVRIAEQLGVCRHTVRMAILRLVQEGVLERKAGLGTRAAKQSVKTNLSDWPSFTREMRAQGIKVEVFSITAEWERPSKEVVRALRLMKAESRRQVLRLERVRGHGGIPSVYSVSWFHHRLKLSGDEDFGSPLYDLIRGASGIVPEYSEEEVSAALADASLAAKLGCAVGHPVLVRVRTVADAGRNVIEYNRNFYRADRFTYGLTIRRGGDSPQPD